jgi:predicted nucleic acid-binding protein
MRKILIDSGPLIALFDGNDRYHRASVAFIQSNTHELVTSLASITETMHLLDFSRYAQSDFLDWISAGAVTLEPVSSRDLEQIKANALLRATGKPVRELPIRLG